MITCYVQYELNPSKIPEFEEYARLWVPLVEKFGGTHHGYYLPHESPNDLGSRLPRRMSVTPAASQTRVFGGTGIKTPALSTIDQVHRRQS